MARTDSFNNFLTDVATSIRTVTGNSEPIPASNFDTEILQISSGKNVVFEYILTEDLEQIDINDLDLLTDGGFYELLVIGGGNKSSDTIGLGVRINGISDDVYKGKTYNSSSVSTTNYISIGCGANGMSISQFGIFDNVLCVTSIGQKNKTAVHFYNASVDGVSNVTSISIVIPSNSLAKAIKAGTQIKLYKRR